MGKGTGSCSRTPLALGGDFIGADAATVNADGSHAHVTSEVIRDPQSLPGRIRGFLSDDAAGWESQPDGESIVKEVSKYPRDLRAWFLEDSVMKDDVYYFESRPAITTNVSDWNLRLLRPSAKLACFDAVDEAHTSEVATAREELMKNGLSLKHGTEAEIEAIIRDKFKHADADGVLEYIRLHGQVVPQTWSTHETTKNTLHGHGEVVYESEANVTKALIDAGAVIRPNPVVMNTSSYYTSKFGSGKCLELQLEDGGVIRYVPHFSVGARTVVEYENQAVFTLSREELLEIKAAQQTEPQPLDAFVSVTSRYKGKDRVRVWHIDDIPEEHRQAMIDARDSGEIRSYERNGKKITESVAQADEAAIVERGWTATDEGYTKAAQDAGLDKLIEQAKTEPLTVDLQWKLRQPVASISDAEPADEDAPLPGYYRRLNAGKLPRSLKKHLSERAPDKQSSKSRIRRDFIPHDAPMSERGQLKTEGMSPDRTLQALQETGLANALAPEVPYRALYGDGPRRGRVLPRHDDFYHGSSLKLPQGYMVVHGMTGAHSAQESLTRLDAMIKTGGLKSIAERRRMGMNVSSTCPDDDTVSRIDQGVPSAITNSPIYGGNIHFVMKPEVLARRDLWFANTSPAGGEAGYKQYTEYGQSLGQERIWMPCPVDGRQKHLDGVPSMNYNEAYFQHEIPWADIDTVVVAQGISKDARARIKKAQEAGLVPESVRVEAVTSSTAATVQGRSKALGPVMKLTEPAPIKAKLAKKPLFGFGKSAANV